MTDPCELCHGTGYWKSNTAEYEGDCPNGCGMDKDGRIDKIESLHGSMGEPWHSETVRHLNLVESERDRLLALNQELVDTLDRIACALADLTTSKDFNCGNTKTYLENMYKDAKEALKHAQEDGK